MSCKYLHNGKEYTKEEIIRELQSGYVFDFGKSTDIYKSVATSKRKVNRTKIVSDTLTMLYQRKKNITDVIQANDLSKDSEKEKLVKKVYYKNILAKTNAQIKELKSIDQASQIEFIINEAKIDAELVGALFSSTNVNFTELQYANNVVETWMNIDKVFGIDDFNSKTIDKDLMDGIIDVKNKFNTLNLKARSIAKQLIIKASKGKLNANTLDMLSDTSWINRKSRDLGTAGIPIASHLDYIIKEVNMKINEEHVKNHSLIDKMTEKIKGNYSLFVKKQKDKNGNETLGIVTRYSQKFWDNLISANKTLRQNLEKANGDKTKTSKAWKNFNEWNEKNTIVFNSLIFIESDKYPESMRTTEINNLKALGFNKNEIDNMIKESKIRYDKYLDKRTEYREQLRQNVIVDPSVIPTGVLIDDYINEKVDEYDNLNNPLKYIYQKIFGAKKITAYGGAKYSYLIPVKSINGKPTEYYDDNFAKIAADPNLYEFYQWFTSFINDNLSWLPQEEIQDLQSNFLPVIADRLAKEYGFSSLKESVSSLGDWFMKALTSTEFEDKKVINPYTGKEVLEFKGRFLSENINVEDRSTNLNVIAKLFSDMALIYKHKNTIKAQVDTVNDIIQTTEGSYKIDKKLGAIRKNKDAVNIQSQAESTVRGLFYGIRPEDEAFKSDKSFYSWIELLTFGAYKSEKSEKAEKISAKIKEIENKLNDDDGSLTEKEIQNLEQNRKDLISAYYKLGGRKFSLTQTIDSMISGTRLTALGLAPFSAFRNLVVGKVNNRVHAKGGRDFTIKDLSWATGKLRDSVASYWSGGKIKTDFSKKVFGLITDIGLAEGEDGIYLQQLMSKNTTLDKFKSMLPKAYTFLSSGDYYFKAELLLAAMKKDKVMTNQGEMSLIDVLNEEREYDEAKYGPWDKSNGTDTFQEYFLAKKLKYKRLADKLHGATGKDVYIEGKDTVIGRALLLFKSWLPETVGTRFDSKKFDEFLDRDEEGYYRTFFKMVMKEKLPKILNLWLKQTFTSQDLDIQDELELANFKKMVSELNTILALTISYMILKAMAPDDDKDKKLYNLLILNQLRDLRRDLTYYINPFSVNELQKSPFPVIRTLLNYADAMKAVTYYGFGVEDEKGELLYDEERTILKITKTLPILSNTNRMLFYMKQVD